MGTDAGPLECSAGGGGNSKGPGLEVDTPLEAGDDASTLLRLFCIDRAAAIVRRGCVGLGEVAGQVADSQPYDFPAIPGVVGLKSYQRVVGERYGELWQFFPTFPIDVRARRGVTILHKARRVGNTGNGYKCSI